MLNQYFNLKTEESIETSIAMGEGDFNVVGEWIYYVNYFDNKIYKINDSESTRLGGETIYNGEATQLCDDKTVHINVLDDWNYYYKKGDDYGRLYKIRTDGSERQYHYQ